jgi:cytoskeletal protein RodZ
VSDTPIPEPIPALRALGQAIRQGREDQGLGIAELASRLNMGQEQLQALEEGDAARLPEPVFVIAQARRVANNLAIDITAPLQTLRDCSQFQARPVKVADLSPRAAGNQPGAVGNGAANVLSAAIPALGRLALAAGVLAALIAGGNAGWQQWQRQQARQPQPGIAPASASAPPAKPAAAQLLLRSSQPSWLEVKTATGTTLFRGTFQGERPFPLGGGLEVLAGRPDLVQAQLGSGPSQPLGPIDQVRWRRFTAPAP